MDQFDEQAREIYSHSVSTGTSMIDAIAAALRSEHERAQKVVDAAKVHRKSTTGTHHWGGQCENEETGFVMPCRRRHP